MHIHNEMAKVVKSAELKFKKRKNTPYVDFVASFESKFTTKLGVQHKSIQYIVRCFGEKWWLDKVLSKAQLGTQLLISGKIDQRTTKTDAGLVYETVIIVNNPNDITFVALEVAS